MHSRVVLTLALGGASVAACAKPRPVEDPRRALTVAAACTDAPVPRRDTLAVSIFATAGFDPLAAPADRAFRDEVLRTILAAYAPPDRMSVPMLETAALAPVDSSSFRQAPGPRFDGELVILLDGKGRATDIRIEGSPDADELLPELAAAARRADSAGAFPSSPSGAATEIRARVFGTGSQVPPPRDPGARVFTVAELTLPVMRLEVPALAVAGAGAPNYPSHLKRMDIQGETTLDFVVDATGRAVPATARTVRASHPDFAKTVMAALPRMRFIPGRIAGCPVASWVRQHFEFRLGRMGGPPPA